MSSTTPIPATPTPEPLLLNATRPRTCSASPSRPSTSTRPPGLFLSIKVGRLRRFRRGDLEAWVDAQGGGPAA